MEVRDNRNPDKPELIIRSWAKPDRAANFRNFRFYPILIFGVVTTLASAAFVLTVVTREILGLSTGASNAPGILLIFGLMALIFYWGVKTLLLRENSGPGFLGFAALILALVFTFLDSAGWYGRYIFAPVFWVFTAVAWSAAYWLAEWESDKAKR